MGFQDEGRMVEQFLKGIGECVQSEESETGRDYVFTPHNISQYLLKMERIEERKQNEN